MSEEKPNLQAITYRRILDPENGVEISISVAVPADASIEAELKRLRQECMNDIQQTNREKLDMQYLMKDTLLRKVKERQAKGTHIRMKRVDEERMALEQNIMNLEAEIESYERLQAGEGRPLNGASDGSSATVEE